MTTTHRFASREQADTFAAQQRKLGHATKTNRCSTVLKLGGTTELLVQWLVSVTTSSCADEMSAQELSAIHHRLEREGARLPF